MRYISLKSFSNKALNYTDIKLRRERFMSAPVEILLEPTKACNSKCIMCLQRLLPNEQGSVNEFLSWEIFNEVKPYFSRAESVLFTGFGEPLLHPNFIEMISEIKKEGPYVYIFTNALVLTPELSSQLVSEGIDEVSVSIAGATEATNRKIRGTPLKPVIENLRELNSLKKKRGKDKPVITFNIVAMNSTIKELTDIIDLASTVGATRIQMPHLTAHTEELRKESPWLQKEQAMQLFEEAHIKAREKHIILKTPQLVEYFKDCRKWLKSIAITWDGFVYSCAQEKHILGNLNENSLGEIWNGEKMRFLRKNYFNKGIQSICPNCRDWNHCADAYLTPDTVK